MSNVVKSKKETLETEAGRDACSAQRIYNMHTYKVISCISCMGYEPYCTYDRIVAAHDMRCFCLRDATLKGRKIALP